MLFRYVFGRFHPRYAIHDKRLWHERPTKLLVVAVDMVLNIWLSQHAMPMSEEFCGKNNATKRKKAGADRWYSIDCRFQHPWRHGGSPCCSRFELLHFRHSLGDQIWC